MGDRSTERLVQALEEAGAPGWLIADAKVGAFHDFKSGSATPIVDLVRRLRKVGLEELAQRAIDGDFDATPEESQAWADGPDGKRLAKEFGVNHVDDFLRGLK